MAETTLIVKVFLGSPGGLEPERETANRVVNEINQSHSEHWGVQIKLVGWEATLPSYSRAQSLINQDLDKCDYFIGVLWDHWGSPPDNDDSKYTSGFEEEFERAKDRLKNKLIKNIALFLKNIPETKMQDPGPSLQKVLAFKKQCNEGKKLLYKAFQETTDFEKAFRSKIEEIGWDNSSVRNSESENSMATEQPPIIDKQKKKEIKSTKGLIATNSVDFINDLLQRPHDYETTTAPEIARLRLIATSINRTGNDQVYLGNHDANLLFIQRNTFNYSTEEYVALIKVGISGFEYQNVPLWHWLLNGSGLKKGFNVVCFKALLGTEEKEKIDALRILQCTGKATPTIENFSDHKKTIQSWAFDEHTNPALNAIQSFLISNGSSKDLTLLEKFYTTIPIQNKNFIALSIVAISAKENVSKALQKLINLNPDAVNQDLTDQLFKNSQSIDTETLEQLLSQKTEIIREEAATILYSRNALKKEIAETLMTDTNLTIRLLAIQCLVQLGVTFEEKSIEKVLVRQKPSGLLGRGDDNTFFEKYKKFQLSKLSYEEVLEKTNAMHWHNDYIGISVLNHSFTRKHLNIIYANLKDGFSSHFERTTQIATDVWDQAKLPNSLRTNFPSFKGQICKTLVTDTLNALCNYEKSKDLALIRNTLDQQEVYFSAPALQYLTKFGDWTDIERIVKFIDRYDQNFLLFTSLDNRAKYIASALYSIGKARLVDLLNLDLNILIRKSLFLQISQKDICNLSDEILLLELNHKDIEHRKIVALKASQALSQKRIRALLDKYIEPKESRFYNSIHWLDLGASLPRKLVKTVTKYELAKLR